jgi:hypothetical protein
MTTVPAETAPRFKTNPLALSSFVLSLVWLVVIPFIGDWMDKQDLAWYVRVVLGVIGSAGAILLGRLAQRQLDRGDSEQTGRGYAYAGILIGWAGLLIGWAVEYWFLLPDTAPAPA